MSKIEEIESLIDELAGSFSSNDIINEAEGEPGQDGIFEHDRTSIARLDSLIAKARTISAQRPETYVRDRRRLIP